jgi:triphosphoribosyl-dephospho-CoA synthase
VYLEFLGRFPDTHVLRKHGPEVAQSVCREGGELLRRVQRERSPEPLLPALEAFDAELKRRAINPGTSADLTVAVLLAHRLERLLGTRSTTARRAPTGAAA